MKIDNKGWGLNTMLIMVGIILFFLLAATFFTIRLNAMLGSENNESEKKLQQQIDQTYYVNRINNMTLAAEKYINDNNLMLTTNHMKIDLNTLVSYGYISPIVDYITTNRCLGYSSAYLNVSNTKVIKSYIKCDNYESKGYGEI